MSRTNAASLTSPADGQDGEMTHSPGIKAESKLFSKGDGKKKRHNLDCTKLRMFTHLLDERGPL